MKMNLNKIIKKFIEKYYKRFFTIGSLLIILSVALSLVTFYLNYSLEEQKKQENIWFTNFYQIVRNEERAQAFLDTRNIIKEINPNSTAIQKLEEAEKARLLSAIRIRHRVINEEAAPMEKQKEWEKLSFAELESLNNDYAEKARLKQNLIIDKQNSIKNSLNRIQTVSTLSNVVGLLLILIYDTHNKEKKRGEIWVRA